MSDAFRTPVRVMSTDEMADRIEELEAELKYWMRDSADAWDKCEVYRTKLEMAVKVTEKSIRWLRLYGADVHRENIALAKIKGEADDSP